MLLLSLRNHAIKSLRPLSFAANVKDFQVENEVIHQYLKGSEERKNLDSALQKYSNGCFDVPIVIGEEKIYAGDMKYQIMPFDHQKKIAKFHWATPDVIKKAITVSLKAQKTWQATPLSSKIELLLRAADLVSTKYRMDLNATTMLGQGKTIIQAEIDAAAELADFFRFNAYFAKELTKYQPISTEPSKIKNSMRYRALEGFIASISPFNFTAIGGNLASAPTLMGNVTLWKPSDTAILSNYVIFQLLKEAGFPAGVINFIPCDGPTFGEAVTTSPHLAGVNFTGSLATFRKLCKITTERLDTYRNFPRIIGECGGKNFHFIHKSADVDTVAVASIRAAFEYSGQKCSALGRMYVPESLASQIIGKIVEGTRSLKLGSPLDYKSFLSAVIDHVAFAKIKGFIDHAKQSKTSHILVGGNCDDSVGYYIEPTVIKCDDPNDRIMTEEIFGPLLPIHVYKDDKVNEVLELVIENQYALTGAVFASDQKFLEYASEILKMSAGNFYLNDKSTGSVVGQQPFGGGRLSGTNDKAGGPHYLLRFASPQVIKESFTRQSDWLYPYMKE